MAHKDVAGDEAATESSLQLTPPIELMLQQRACRSFTSDHVEDDALETMLEAATHAPSAENAQPWVFVVVRERATLDAIVQLTQQVWHGGGRAHAELSLEPSFLASVDAFVESGYGGAPVLVVVAGDAGRAASTAVLASSVYPAVQNLLLAAAALGYGSSMTTLAAQAPDALAAILSLPADIRPFAVVPIGRPAHALGAPRRRPVAEVAHRDRYGTPFNPVSD